MIMLLTGSNALDVMIMLLTDSNALDVMIMLLTGSDALDFKLSTKKIHIYMPQSIVYVFFNWAAFITSEDSSTNIPTVAYI